MPTLSAQPDKLWASTLDKVPLIPLLIKLAILDNVSINTSFRLASYSGINPPAFYASSAIALIIIGILALSERVKIPSENSAPRPLNEYTKSCISCLSNFSIAVYAWVRLI